jgi:predicted transcriptional regulator
MSADKKAVDTGKPYGLHAAIHILKCLSSGESKKQLVKDFDGDEQLVSMWMSFLLHNRWMIKDDPEKDHWVTTDKGQDWIDKYEGVGYGIE